MFSRVYFEKVSCEFFSLYRSDLLCSLDPGDRIASCHTRKKYEIIEVGIMHPEELSTDSLRAGQVGFIACNMKESSEGFPGSSSFYCI